MLSSARTLSAVVVGTLAGLLLLVTLFPATAEPGERPAAAGLSASVRADQPYTVTYVARVCDEYTDIMANRARNNIQESLRDLGGDTVYSSTEAVSYDVESQVASQLGCRPMVDWRLTLGTGITGKSPSTQNLSTITGAYGTTITTRSSTPLLGPSGAPVGGQVEGAVTVPLTEAQAERAQRGSSLWVQGGTPSQPLNGLEEQYGFGALRCAVDNLNGDNVEWIGFPSAARHVFCYYYSVQPPPEAGTIVVRKAITADSSGPESFDFTGNVSYNPGGAFSLTANNAAPGSVSFIRGETTPGVPPWDFQELPTDGWDLVGGEPTCQHPGASTVTVTGARVSVDLAAGDVVTCTYLNRRQTTAPLALSKVTLGGTGTFPFRIDTPGNDVDTEVTTQTDGDAVEVATTDGAPPGTFTATETLPADTVAGSWDIDEVTCDGVEQPFVRTGQEVTASRAIAADESVDCLFTNRYTPAGSITIRKVTRGGVGTFGYVVTRLPSPRLPEGAQFRQAATTVDPDVTVVATGDALDGLPVTDPGDRYVIRELLPPDTTAGSWRAVSIDCGPAVRTTLLRRIAAIVRVNPQQPQIDCTFENVFVPSSRLVLTKVVDDPDAVRTGPVHVELTCDDGTRQVLSVNRGADAGALAPLTFLDDVTCRVRESSDGAPDTTPAQVSVTVDRQTGPPVVTSGPSADVVLTSGDDVRVTVTNTYEAAPATTGPSTDQPDGPSTGNTDDLPDTGASSGLVTALIAGLVLCCVGVLLVLRRGPRERERTR
ncbi:prealbumin-like fold domain-containing protein [Nocardioides sp.]|uniref:prealbumin-like fold domain-containing protein n=1 Tax=Nocardioides sp. TaxID=35761 RepID=UPI003D0F266D